MKHTDGTKCAGENCAWAGMPDHQAVPDTIEIGAPTKHFLMGAAAGRDVIEAHKDTPFPDEATRVAYYWFYCGGLAVEGGLADSEEFGMFILGARTVAPVVEVTS